MPGSALAGLPVGGRSAPRLWGRRTRPRDGAMVRKGVQTTELLVDGLREGEGIELRPERRELGHLRRIGLGAGLDAVEGGLRAAVDPPDPGPHADLLCELDRRQKQVLEEPEVLPVERVHGGHGGGGIVAHVAQELPDVRPVLLLDVGVVVLLVRAPPGELNPVALAVPDEVGVDELGAVIGIDPPQGEGQRLPHRLQRLLHRVLAPAQDGPGLHPGGVNVREV